MTPTLGTAASLVPVGCAVALVAFLAAYLVVTLAMTVVVVLAPVGVLVVAVPLAWRTRRAFVVARHVAATHLDVTAAEERRLRITNPAMLDRSLRAIRASRNGT